MNEDKVKEAQHIAEVFLSGYNGADETVAAINKRLIEAIAPEQPEIPEGCPVLVWDGDETDSKAESFYQGRIVTGDRPHGADGYAWENAEIDYQRKGHVIPWHGGECPVDGEELVTVFVGGISGTGFAEHQLWAEVTSYMVWPEWVKEE